MVDSPKSIDERIMQLVDSGIVTEAKVLQDLVGLDNPFDRLDYLNQILTYSGLGLQTLKTEKNLPKLIAELQKPEISAARDLSEKDSTSGVYNSGAVMRRMQRPRENYCVLMLDIDHFKHFNDTYGHDMGDRVIKNTARTMLENLRESFIGRIGGEEFYVELNIRDLEGGRIAAERVRKAIEENVISYVIEDLIREDRALPQGLKEEKVTVSIGVANEKQKTAPHEARLRADLALYDAKTQGRNRVIVYK